jgi:hypothetical protein
MRARPAGWRAGLWAVGLALVLAAALLQSAQAQTPALPPAGVYLAFDPADAGFAPRPVLELRAGLARLLFEPSKEPTALTPVGEAETAEARRAIAEMNASDPGQLNLQCYMVERMRWCWLQSVVVDSRNGRQLPEFFLLAPPIIFFHLRKQDP